MAQGTGKVDWKEVFSDGTDPTARASAREEVGNNKYREDISSVCYSTLSTAVSAGLVVGSNTSKCWAANHLGPLALDLKHAFWLSKLLLFPSNHPSYLQLDSSKITHSFRII